MFTFYISDIATPTTYILHNTAGPGKVTLDILTEQVVPNMATKWFEMGLQLGVNPKDLKTIQHDAKNSKAACTEMFTEWLGNANTEKSWKKVLDALCSRSVGENTLAKNLKHLTE